MIQWTVAENVIKMQKIKALRRRQANERAR
ncbi:hypothetical protein GFC29_3831 (plasmid) [Anoxybacillus sp. B7M1]|nr:hypothetical protein GFC29_3831 [Anoxybacillus sp. B7M1]